MEVLGDVRSRLSTVADVFDSLLGQTVNRLGSPCGELLSPAPLAERCDDSTVRGSTISSGARRKLSDGLPKVLKRDIEAITSDKSFPKFIREH